MRTLRRGRLTYPVACYPAPPCQWHEPDSILGRLDAGLPPSNLLDSRFSAAGLFNGAVYAMTRLRTRPRLRMDAYAAWYFDSLNTSETLELELLEGRPHPPGLRHLEGSGRTAAIGIATLLALRRPPGYDLVLGRLAPKAMAHRAGQRHVAPAGMFAPPYSVTANVAVELREELGLDLSAGRLYLSGAAVNLLNLRPEICTVFVMDDPGPLAANEEFLPGLERVPLAADAGMIRALHLTPDSVTPPGAAALFLGARLLRSLNSQRAVIQPGTLQPGP